LNALSIEYFKKFLE